MDIAVDDDVWDVAGNPDAIVGVIVVADRDSEWLVFLSYFQKLLHTLVKHIWVPYYISKAKSAVLVIDDSKQGHLKYHACMLVVVHHDEMKHHVELCDVKTAG